MRIVLTEIQKAKKEQKLCIVPGCPNRHGKGINICYSHKRNRYEANKADANRIKLAYDDYCISQVRHEMPMISFDTFESQHIKKDS